jgi:hypothetical protein
MALLIHAFLIPKHWYVFDANTNSVLSVSEEEHRTFAEIEHGVKTQENTALLHRFQEKGFCCEANIEEIRNPESDIIAAHLNKKLQQITYITHNLTGIIHVCFILFLLGFRPPIRITGNVFMEVYMGKIFKIQNKIKQMFYLCGLLTILASFSTGCAVKTNGTQSAGGELVKNAASATDMAAVMAEDITGEITLWCYEKNPILDIAIPLFEAKYPGTKVTVETFEEVIILPTKEEIDPDTGEVILSGGEASANDAQAELNYVRGLNTEIMGGRGPDILEVDIIPWYKYADMGYLEDLRPYMDTDPDFNYADYRMNIMDALKYKGCQYIMPLGHRLPYFAYDETLFSDEERKVFRYALAKNLLSCFRCHSFSLRVFIGACVFKHQVPNGLYLR